MTNKGQARGLGRALSGRCGLTPERGEPRLLSPGLAGRAVVVIDQGEPRRLTSRCRVLKLWKEA